MNPHALTVLEFPRVLDLVAARATTELGAERIRGLSPTDDRAFLDREHARVAALRAGVEADEPWHPEPVPDLRRALGRLRAEGSAFSGGELLAAYARCAAGPSATGGHRRHAGNTDRAITRQPGGGGGSSREAAR